MNAFQLFIPAVTCAMLYFFFLFLVQPQTPEWVFSDVYQFGTKHPSPFTVAAGVEV